MKKNPFGIIDLRHQNDHITLKKVQLFQERNTDLDNASLFLIIFRRREIKLISKGNKVIEVTVI